MTILSNFLAVFPAIVALIRTNQEKTNEQLDYWAPMLACSKTL